MDREQSQRIRDLVEATLELKPEERTRFLRDQCSDDPVVLKAVEAVIETRLAAPTVSDTLTLEHGSIPDLDPGRIVSHYRLIEQIGKGGMGVVWRAEDTILRRDVALKFLPESPAAQSRQLARFQREARFLASLNHPNIAAIHGLEEAAGHWFLVLEFVRGVSLAERLKHGPLPVEKALEVCRLIARGLEAAHARGLIHRDLKPANVQTTPDRQLKLLDFGLAKAFGDAPSALEFESTITVAGTILGTPAYMSPEQASAGETDKRTDIWSFGCILYETLTGSRVFPAVSTQETLAAIQAHEPNWAALPRDVPERARALLRKCLAKDVERRLHDIADVRIEIEDTLLEVEQASSHPEARKTMIASLRSLIGSQAVTAHGDSGPLVSRVLVLMRTSIGDAVDLQQRIGTVAYGGLVTRHDEILGSIVGSIPGAAIVHDTGSGFDVCFLTPSEAVDAALRFQRAVHTEPWEPERIQVQVGLHLGEISAQPGVAGGADKILGAAVDTATQVMGLAIPGQILMTTGCFDDARQNLHQDAASVKPEQLAWMDHGPYLIQGRDEPIRVFEVGEEGIEPLVPPPDTFRAQRAFAAHEGVTFGWRPANGQAIPGRRGWSLERKLGFGGFGEVWLAIHQKTKERRVFKFCFDADRLRSFRREVTLFRLIRESLGERNDIAKIHEIQLEHAPFFLESEFTELGDLGEWSSRIGGLESIPLGVRLDFVARTADAVAAAHSVGILHKDIKPSNILVYLSPDEQPWPRLSDFGIGALTDLKKLESQAITAAGFTETELIGNESSRTGTRMYAPPESLTGEPFSIQGDIYALGVLLYQMTVGDLQRPLAEGWERDVVDPILRNDIAACVDRDRSRRPQNAADLASRLRGLEERQIALRRRKRNRVLGVVATSVVAFAVVAVLLLSVHTVRVQREAETAKQVSRFLMDMFAASDPDHPDTSIRDVLERGTTRIDDQLHDQPIVKARLLSMLGDVYLKLGMFDDALELFDEALQLRRDAPGVPRSDLFESLNNLGIVHVKRRDDAAAGVVFEEARVLGIAALGPDDPDMATLLRNYADLMLRAGKLDRAREFHEEALRIREATYGSESPEVASSLRGLAKVAAATGDNELAKRQIERSCDITERTQGSDHTKAGQCRYDLGKIYVELGQYDDATSSFGQARGVFERRLGPSHRYVRVCVSKLANAHRLAGNSASAYEFYELAVELEVERLGSDHPDVASRLTEYSEFLREDGQDARAEALANRAAAILGESERIEPSR